MPLVHLIYVSKPVKPIVETLATLTANAHLRNKEHSIGGLLIAGESFFLQLIEGNRLQVNQLFRNILKDDSHDDVMILRYAEVKEREFGEWSMLFTSPREIAHELIPTIVHAKEILPSELTGVQALSLIRRFAILLRALQESRSVNTID